MDITLPYQSKDDKAIGDGQYLFEATWNAIFAAIAPSLMDEAPESAMRAALKTFIHSFGVFDLDEDDDILAYDHRVDLWTVLDSSFQTIKIQLRALGLIEKSTKPRSVRDTRTMWTLTRLGDETMTRLRAVRKGEEADSGARP